MIDLQKIAKGIKEKYSSVSVAEDIPDLSDYVSTGNLALDLISDGGIPFGYCVEFLGLSASGKSLLLQKILANAQQKYNAVGVMADRENCYTNTRGEQLGINNNKLLVAKPSDIPTAVDGFSFLIDTISSIRKVDEEQYKKKLAEDKEAEHIKTYIVAILDSVAAFDKDVTLDKSDSGRKAKSVHEGLRKILPYIDEKVMFLVANQVTYKIGILWGDPKTSTSGESMKYYSTIRLALEDRKQIVDSNRGNEVIGSWIGVEVIKTRLGPCHRSCYFRHLYETGIDYFSGYGRLLSNRNYLSQKNKAEFKAFKQSTLLYNAGIKDKEEKVSEHQIEKFLEVHPELLFDKYPEYKIDGKEKVEDE